MKIGDKILFWQDTRPLLDRHAFKAEVTELFDDEKSARVTVTNPARMRIVDGRSVPSTFSVLAPISERAAPGVVTEEGVAAGTQHAPDSRIGDIGEPKMADDKLLEA